MKITQHIGDQVEETVSHEGGTVAMVNYRAPVPHLIVEGDHQQLTSIPEYRLQPMLETSKDKRVIALTGEDRVGKSRTADVLESRLGSTAIVLSFANPLRNLVKALNYPIMRKDGETFGWKAAFAEAEEAALEEAFWREDELRGRDWERMANDYLKGQYPSSRDVLINVAESIKAFNPTFFVDLMLQEIDWHFSTGYDYIIIDDLRFNVEFTYLNQMLHDLQVFRLYDPNGEIPGTWEQTRWVGESGGAEIPVKDLSGAGINKAAQDILKPDALRGWQSIGYTSLDDILDSDPIKGDTVTVAELDASKIEAGSSYTYTFDDGFMNFSQGLNDLMYDYGSITYTPTAQESTQAAEQAADTLARQAALAEVQAALDEAHQYTPYITSSSYERILQNNLRDTPYLDEISDRIEELKDQYGIYPSTDVLDKVMREVLHAEGQTVKNDGNDA